MEFPHHALADGEVVTLGNVDVQAIATPGHALAHHAYLVTDHTRADEPWLVLTGDASPGRRCGGVRIFMHTGSTRSRAWLAPCTGR